MIFGTLCRRRACTSFARKGAGKKPASAVLTKLSKTTFFMNSHEYIACVRQIIVASVWYFNRFAPVY